MTAVRAYLSKVALGFIGGAVGVLLAGAGCTAWDRAAHHRRVHQKAIREAELPAAVAAHPAGEYATGEYTERNMRRDGERAA